MTPAAKAILATLFCLAITGAVPMALILVEVWNRWRGNRRY